MRLNEYADHDGVGLAELVRSKKVTAKELGRVALDAIRLLEPEISALVDVFDEEVDALSQDTQPEGVFGGVPMLIKDCLLMMEGKPLLNGSRLCQGMTAPHDSDLMTRYRATGVTVVGLTKAPEFGYNPTTEPLAGGPVHNPWRKGLSAGGSSGGTAAAVVAGYTPFGHGNDGGGSIRIPASACGLVGLKPTRGRNPLGPDFGEALFGMSCEHILSRTVRDSAVMLDCTSGPGVGDPYSIPRSEGGFAADLDHAPRKLTIGFSEAPPWAPPPQPDVAAAVRRAVEDLTGMGHELRECAPHFDKDALNHAISTAWIVGESAWIHATAQAAGRMPGPDTLEQLTWNIYREGQAMTASGAILTVLGGFNQGCRSIARFFENHDILVIPTVAQTARPHGELNQNADLSGQEWWDQLQGYMPYTAMFNVTGQPSISLPLGVSMDGLPIGVQIVARFGAEALLLRIARQFELARPWRDRHPATSVWSKTA